MKTGKPTENELEMAIVAAEQLLDSDDTIVNERAAQIFQRIADEDKS